jgi:antitoxin component YwqK of YwqJK toxin-antitoxin module
MTHNTYSLLNNDKTLISEEKFDEKGNLVSKMIHNTRPKTQFLFAYDTKNRLICERELNQDWELSRSEFEYDEAGDIVEQRTYLSGSLFESITMTKNEKGYVRITMQDDEELERYEKDISGENWNSRFYEGKTLLAEHQYTFDPTQRKARKTIHEIEYDLSITSIETFDEENKPLKLQEYSNETSLMFEKEYFYENKHLVKITFKDFERKLGDYSYVYDRDTEGKVIKYSCLSDTGILLSFHNFIYDDQGRIIEEFGVRNAQYDEIPTSNNDIEKFHLMHEYQR